jgi:uncharacterized membrane protein/glutaredoxin
MSRRRPTPWIHRFSRPLIGGIAILGALVTGYLTFSHQTGNEVACVAGGGCDAVLTSPYASLFGLVPLSLFGCLAYVGMATFALGPLAVNPVEKKELRKKLEEWSWLLLLAGAIAMVIFSGYLMFVLATKIKVLCLYCIASACFTVAMLAITLLGRAWEDIGQLLFIAFIVGLVTLVGSLGLYIAANPDSDGGGSSFNVTTSSGAAELALARHLTKADAKMYGAYWCPHCQDQKQLFGKEASKQFTYIECDPAGKNAQPELCQAAKIASFPTWEIDGKFYRGTQPLTELGRLTGYTGPQNYQNVISAPAAPASPVAPAAQ